MLELGLKLPPGALRQFKTLQRVSRTMAAKSLTFTAEKAVPAWRAGHSVFHRRNRWIDNGVRMRAATASTLTARVGSIDRYMGRHVVGVGQRKTGRLFIPRYGAAADVGTHTRERRRVLRMGSTTRKPFRLGDMWVRRKGKKRTPLVVLGFMRKSAQVEPRLDALDIVGDTVATVFPTVYERLLLKWAKDGRA